MSLQRTAEPKPSRLARDVSKWERRVTREKATKAEKRKADAAWTKRSAECRDREKGVCQVCTCQTVRAGVGDPRLYGQAHHIIYRSAGGPDDLWNLAWLCGQCSDDEHTHKIAITGTGTKLQVRPVRGVSVARSVR